MLDPGRTALLLVALAACRLSFDPVAERGDAAGGRDGDALAGDAPDADATVYPTVFAVGTFTKIGAVGEQVVPHTLGAPPRVLILFSSGHATQTFSTSTSFALGFVDQDRTSRAVAIYSEDNAARVSDRRMSTGAITFVGDNATTIADANVTAWDAAAFTLDWTVNNGGSEILHYFAIGGSAVSSRVVGWTMPDMVGQFSLANIGFQPDAVLHAHAAAGLMTPPPSNLNQAGLGLGAMTTTGQWALSTFSSDGGATTNTQRGMRLDACVYAFDAMEVELRRATYNSMEAQGFTINFDIVGAANTQAFSLALAGVNVQAGTFPKPTSGGPPGGFGVGGALFQGSALLLASVQDSFGTAPVPHARFGFGAGTATDAAAVAFSDTDGLAVASVDSVTRTGSVYVKVDNDTATIDAEFGLPNFAAQSFGAPFIANDATDTRIAFVLFGVR